MCIRDSCYHYVLTRQTHYPTNKNVRFKAQTYTDRGPTNKFKNGYNNANKEIIFPIHLLNFFNG